MSEDRRKTGRAGTEDQDGSESSKGINLTLVYSLIGLAFVAAIVIAMYIVLPFYHRR